MQGRQGVSSFRTRRLDAALLTGPTLVLVASRRHRTAVTKRNPRAAGRTFTLPEMARYAAALEAPGLKSVGSGPGSPWERLAAVVTAAAALRGTLSPERSGEDDMADPYRQGADAMRATVAEVDAWLRSSTALLLG